MLVRQHTVHLMGAALKIRDTSLPLPAYNYAIPTSVQHFDGIQGPG